MLKSLIIITLAFGLFSCDSVTKWEDLTMDDKTGAVVYKDSGKQFTGKAAGYSHRGEQIAWVIEVTDDKVVTTKKFGINESMDQFEESPVSFISERVKDGQKTDEFEILYTVSDKKFDREGVLMEEVNKILVKYHNQKEDSPIDLMHGVERKYYDDSKKLRYEINYQYDEKHGKYLTFHKKTGKPLKVENYVKGKLDGQALYYNDSGDGKLRVEQNWKNGMKHGKFLKFWSDGTEYYHQSYENDVRHGKCIDYLDDGYKLVTYEFKHGNKHGTWTYNPLPEGFSSSIGEHSSREFKLIVALEIESGWNPRKEVYANGKLIK